MITKIACTDHQVSVAFFADKRVFYLFFFLLAAQTFLVTVFLIFKNSIHLKILSCSVFQLHFTKFD